MPDFDAVVDRRYRGARKWDRYASSNSLGELVYDKQVLPMWVADMEIKAPDAVLDALRTEVDHGLFGYVVSKRAKTASLLYPDLLTNRVECQTAVEG